MVDFPFDVDVASKACFQDAEAIEESFRDWWNGPGQSYLVALKEGEKSFPDESFGDYVKRQREFRQALHVTFRPPVTPPWLIPRG